MYNIVKNYVSVMKKEDIQKFAIKNNLTVTKEEIDFIYDFIKNNYEYVLKNPHNFDINKYQNKFSQENFIFLTNLVNKYKRMII